MQADRMIHDAQFIVDSLPNVEPFAVERALRQLSALHYVFANLEDAWLDQDDLNNFIALVLKVQLPLQQFQELPPPSSQYWYHYNTWLHDMGNSWDAIAEAMGVAKRTLYYHLERAELSTERRPFTEISDDDLDENVAAISIKHPLAGSAIVMGHLEAIGIHLPSERVQESLWRVDGIGVIVRWNGVIKRRVYRVRGANALWHMDGNEKLRPWGFYVHGCVDGHSRLIIYLVCCNNKRSSTVESLWLEAVAKYGWPSRGRGDFGKENNGVERRMIRHWGALHRAFLRGRSTQNIRMERCWRDVRKDTLELFRQIFFYLEQAGLLDMENPIHRVCLYIVFQSRIQRSLDETRSSWNLHKVRTAGNKTPQAIYELSKTRAINRGYWTGDPGDDITTASDPAYGEDPEERLPPADELAGDPIGPDHSEYADLSAERDAGVFVNEDGEIRDARDILRDLETDEDDGNWGIDVYCRAVVLLTSYLNETESE
ncbi:Integrase catalytic domain-containing protein [Mycena venus]|uniref:Integrase catalytic domain-containing protein n=1 Tax=Mycena venus TaxID=2733690 RepID=A0A8H6Z8X8_9AGAR|nr:Integrase catalytic domain-containing protein [Mycena venus]